MTFTERIKQLRKQRQLSQCKVAEAFDTDSVTYYKIERGELLTMSYNHQTSESGRRKITYFVARRSISCYG